jgi:hypothetical protein
MTTPSRDEERADRDAALDETLAATFPASDPLSSDPNPAHPNEQVRNAEPARTKRPPAPPSPGRRTDGSQFR